MDTGADVTVIAQRTLPSHWPTSQVHTTSVGIGGQTVRVQSAHVIQVVGPKGIRACVRVSLGTGLPLSVGTEFGDSFIIGAFAVQRTLVVIWKSSDPAWVGQWPLSSEKLHHLHELIQEQFHVIPTASPWSSAVFVIRKKNGKWRLLQDLRQANAVVEEMGPLQSGLPSPTMIPKDWCLTAIDLRDCFFTIPLDPQDAPKSAFSVPSSNASEPAKRYHWTLLPQGMKNSPSTGQWFVARALFPAKERLPHTTIYHYMNDILVATQSGEQMQHAMTIVLECIRSQGLEVAPEKAQESSPWTYLGWRNTNQNIASQCLKISTEVRILNDKQKLLGAINWVRTMLAITWETLHPLFQLFKGEGHGIKFKVNFDAGSANRH